MLKRRKNFYIFVSFLTVVLVFGYLAINPTIGQGTAPEFYDLVFPEYGAVLAEGETFISGKINAPNGLPQGPELMINNFRLLSSDGVLLEIEGEDNYFEIEFSWPDLILQSGQVLLELSVEDNLGFSTSVQTNATATPNPVLLSLQQERRGIAMHKGSEVAGLFADLGMFLSDVEEFGFDTEVANILSGMVSLTSAAGRIMSNPWKPHIQDAIDDVRLVSAPDEVASRMKSDLISFLEFFYDYAEFHSDNFVTYIPAPDVDPPLIQASIDAYNSLLIESSVLGEVGHFGMSMGGISLFEVNVDKTFSPPLVFGHVDGRPLTEDEMMHPLLATKPVLEKVYLEHKLDRFQNTVNKGGV